MRVKALMVQGTSSGAGKTTLVAALCRIFSDMGYAVAPFKSQNMSRLEYRGRGFVISQAQAVQALAARSEPEPDMNPIVIRPHGNDSSTVYVGGRRLSRMSAAEYYRFAPREGLGVAVSALERLAKKNDLLIIEGAGSPAEINLKKYDIANMRIAERAKCPVLLVTDVDRGGSFASLAGTMQLLEEKHREMVRGFVFNKFRGDDRILRPGFAALRKLTGVPVLGLVPYARTGLPGEDSLDGPDANPWTGGAALERNIARLAGLVRENVNMSAIEGMVR